MFRLRKLHPPLGSRDNPFIEPSYAEGAIPVVDGLCDVRLPETRDRLLKLGYSEAGGGEPADEDAPPPASPRRRWKRVAKAKPGGK